MKAADRLPPHRPGIDHKIEFEKGTVTIMVLANALSYQNASGPFNNGPTELT